jgi:hypothetical protein
MTLPGQSAGLPPTVQAEIEAVARDLDTFGMRRTAARLRGLLGELPDDEKPYPVQDREAGYQVRAIPWGLMEILYPAYGHDQTMERLAERGGFGRKELGSLACDAYSGSGRPRLARMPLLTLYDLARQSR